VMSSLPLRSSSKLLRSAAILALALGLTALASSAGGASRAETSSARFGRNWASVLPSSAADGSRSVVPLHPALAQGSRLMAGDRTVDPQVSMAVRPADDSVLAVWNFSPSTKSDGYVEAQRLDAMGRPMGAAFRADAAPPSISGYHYVAGGDPHVAYSPSSDSWVVVFTGEYIQDSPCPTMQLGRKTVPRCASLTPVMSIRVDSAGQIISGPTILIQEPVAAHPATIACRPGGCALVWARCRSLGECSFGSNPPSVVVLPLDANGTVTVQNPSKISTGLCEPRGYVNDDRPNAPTVTPTGTGYIVSWNPQTPPPAPGCIVLRAINPMGTPSGPEVMVSRRPSGLRRSVTPMFSSQQTCSYQGGQRILVTWLVGEAANRPAGSDLRYYGLYRQVFGNKGQLIGGDTRGVRSVADVPPPTNARYVSKLAPDFQQTANADLWQNRCVVFATSLNKVDAYVYDQSGAIRQRANLFRYNRPTTGYLAPFDLIDAAWSPRGGFLLKLHTQQANDPFTISSYPLQ